MRTPFLVACLCLLGCGGGSGSTTCALSAQVSGPISWQSQSDPACLSPFSGSSGSEMSYQFIDSEVARFTADVASVMGGQTGAFPAKVEILHRDGRKWSTATTGCSVILEENTFLSQDQLGKSYQTSGRGTCTGAAMPSGSATGTLTVAPFTFRFVAHFF